MNLCPVCGSTSHVLDSVDINKSCEDGKGAAVPYFGVSVDYRLCDGCGFCFCPEIAAWSIEQFASRIYNEHYVRVDPDYERVRPLGNFAMLKQMFGKVGKRIKHLDYGGGNGLMAKTLKGSGWKSTSYDPFVDKVAADGLGKFDLITAFEVFEHVPDPQKLMLTLKALLSNDGMVMFSTLLSDGSVKEGQKLDWWYASPRNGHISLYSQKSLVTLAKQYGLTVASMNQNLHVMYATVPTWAGSLIR